jgi:penicillin-binding protein 2
MNASHITPRAKGAQASSRRFFWAQLAVGGAFLTLIIRLWTLQVMAGEHYFKKSADNFVKENDLPATRGRIYDRKRRLLADNRPLYQVMVTPRFFTATAFQRLRELVPISEEHATALWQKVSQKHGRERDRQLLALEEITRDQLALLEMEKQELPGVQVSPAVQRTYPLGPLGSHVVGYLGQIGAEELQERRDLGYQLGDRMGRSGLERQWEAFLRGKDGYERIVVDAKGQRKADLETKDLVELIGNERRVEPQPGNDLVTTLDIDLMRIVERALRRHRSAAAAVVEVETGRVLALASWPEADPNRLTSRITRAELERYMTDPLRPLVDKTVRENYFPGSTFKIVPMLAAMADHKVDDGERIVCRGALKYGNRSFHCEETHGSLSLRQALARSCNVFFYELGDRLGLDRIAEVAFELGFGASTGLGLNGEVPGFVPTMEYYKQQGGFQKGLVLNNAIGQGIKTTVLQVAMAYAAIANGGRLFVPTLVERIEKPSGEAIQLFPPQVRRTLPFSSAQLQAVRSALYDAVYDPKGTSYAVRVPGLEVAGKTGTAQVGRTRHGSGPEGDPLNPHAWFASFAPADHPKIVVVVLVEHGGFGAKAATPTAMEIYRRYFVEVDPGARPANFVASVVPLTAVKAKARRR